jgi:hypothetical protein
MRNRAEVAIEGLLALERYEPAERRAVFRQSFAALALSPPGLSPLTGCDEAALARSVRIAAEDGFFESLDWLAPATMGCALYEIAGALPLGQERREIGRLVLERLYEGNATTFASIATRMATSGAARALAGIGIRARVALVLGLPSSTDVPRDGLALAFVSRRDLAVSWLGAHAIGSLPSRRMAARLLEGAAREAASRARHGDGDAVELFHAVLQQDVAGGSASPETIGGAFRTLLADRETLVWRHVAVARGLLARAMPQLAREIETSLEAHLSPTEWRRGSASLAANIAVEPSYALPRAIALLKSPLMDRDPGIATAMLWGLSPVLNTEPEAAVEVVDAMSQVAPLYVAEDLIEVLAEAGGLGGAIAVRCATALSDAFGEPVGEEEVSALSARLAGELLVRRARGDIHEDDRRPDMKLRGALEQAVDGFVERGTREAHALAQVAFEHASRSVALLESLRLDDSGAPVSASGRASSVCIIRELDIHLLESGTLKNLLLLDRGPGDTTSFVPEADELDERLARWLLVSETAPFTGEATSAQVMPHQRRLRALLHVMDGETTELDDNQEHRERLQERWTSTCRQLLTRLAAERATPLRRAVAATVARSLDALVRDGAADPADVLLYAAFRTKNGSDLQVLGEASMNPGVWRLVRAYARFAQAEHAVEKRAGRTLGDASCVRPLDGFLLELPVSGSQRVEAIRSSLLRLTRALVSTLGAVALRPLADPELSPLSTLEAAIDRLAQLTASALRRCGGEDEPIAALPSPAFPLALSVIRALEAGGPEAAAASIAPVIATCIERAEAALPGAIASLVKRVIPRIAELPLDEPGRDSRTPAPAPSRPSDGPVPPWVPSRRTLGGFYVHRQIGGGGAGTVFVVTRIDERHDPAAERFALKVPDYDATAARSLSETAFLKLFREEAGALLAVPEHENLARFVTFDAGARPKPILVMELVDGTRCDKLIASRLLTMKTAFSLLDGVLAGLAAMHSVGVGHLDVKPSNVILRAGVQPVLVDFGLAGRHIRPGCGTTSYGAPEVWGITLPGARLTPMSADVYSFGCLGYEVLTGRTLFEAPSEVAVISAHVTHDGLPPPLKRLAERSQTAPVAQVLERCLRKDPADRAAANELREQLGAVGDQLRGKKWPVPV